MVENDSISIDTALRYFPRNLSYSEEGYVDCFSVSSPYVKVSRSKPDMEYIHSRYMRDRDTKYGLNDADADASTVDIKVVKNGTSIWPCWWESEDGILVNMMDNNLCIVESAEDSGCVQSASSYLEAMNTTAKTEIGNSCEQKCSSADVCKEVQKTEVAKSEIALKSKDSKIAVSDENLTMKCAHLKVNYYGKQLNCAAASKIMLAVDYSTVCKEPEFNINCASLRKSSSLKTAKTPPGTPSSSKKMVRFADALGLDLESVRTVLDADNPPRIPASAIAAVKFGMEKDRRDVGSRYLDLCFQQPGAASNFLERVMAAKIALENCRITDMNINGIVRVANIGYHKCVRIRYTTNNWMTFYDIMASYVQNSCDGVTDRFSFIIVAPPTLEPGSMVSFALSYTVHDYTYWDSNFGKNYEVICYAKATPTELNKGWVHFL